jgi:hypothetical protein
VADRYDKIENICANESSSDTSVIGKNNARVYSSVDK